MAIYKIFEHGEEINRIVADENFVSQWCLENGYTYELEAKPMPEPGPEPEQEPTVEELVNILLGV